MAYSILKGAASVPEEVELLRELDRLQIEFAAATADAPAREGLEGEIARTRLKLDLAIERARR